jgi:hypothetical protein
MAAQGKPAEAGTRAPGSSIPGLLGEWVRQGAEGFIATQKILLDLVAQQNALALTIIRERIGALAPSPSGKIVELAGRGVENFMEAQKALLDLAGRQNAIIADGFKPVMKGTVFEPLAEVAQQGLENFIAAQKTFLQMAEAQTKGAVEDYRQGKGLAASRLAELARDGMRTFVDSQKRFLDIVEEQIVEKKEPAPAGEEPAPRRIDIFEMAKQSIDALVEAQKRLLDVASDQIEVNVRFTREAFRADGEERPVTSLTEVMRKSIDSFVAAQKAMVDLASKPRKPAAEETAASESRAMTAE